MSVLVISSIRAVNDADPGFFLGDGEPYLNINGQRVWSGNAEEGATVGVGTITQFDNSALVELFEEDGGLAFNDDYIGSFAVSSLSPGFNQSVTLDEPAGDGLYVVNYSVI